MRYKFKDIPGLLKNSLLAILRGKFLLKLNLDRYFVHILYTFFMFAVVIWVSLKIDDSMAKVEKNNRQIEELRIANRQKEFEIVRLSKRSAVKANLKKMHSDVHENDKPAYRLEK